MDHTAVWIVMPAYNEAQVILDTVSPLLAAGYQVVVVDDASDDETSHLLIGKPSVHYLRHAVNLGQGAALETGMRYAYQRGAQWLVHFDADGQHRMEDIPALLMPLWEDRADVALGSRFMTDQASQAVPWTRKCLLRTAIGVNFLFTGLWLRDAHNGLRALNRKALGHISLQAAGMAHATEILQQIRRHRLRFVEVPVEIRYTDYSRQKGQSFWNAFNILGHLLARQFLHR